MDGRFILGVRIDATPKKEILTQIREFLQSTTQHMICTPNPEMLVAARKDHFFKEILNDSDLNVCDGKGIQLASLGSVERIPGVELMQEICNIAVQENRSVYLLGSFYPSILEKCAENLKIKYPGLRIVGYESSLIVAQQGDTQVSYDKEENDRVLEKIIMSAPDVLFVAFGHGKQEKWIYENLQHLPSVKIAMGVGGAFDFIAGHVARAPVWMRRAGLEWLWRLLRQPWRAGRIWNALVVFPFCVMLDHLKKEA